MKIWLVEGDRKNGALITAVLEKCWGRYGFGGVFKTPKL